MLGEHSSTELDPHSHLNTLRLDVAREKEMGRFGGSFPNAVGQL